MIETIPQKFKMHENKRFSAIIIILFLACIVLLGASVWYASADEAPKTFPVDTDVTIEEGMSVKEIANHLKSTGVINSPFIFNAVLSQEYSGEYLKAGTYKFTEPLDTRSVINALVEGDFQSPLLKVTFPEGFRIKDFNVIFSKSSESSNEEVSLSKEGYLFPDTYFIKMSTTQEELITMMEDNYTKKITTLSEQIKDSKFSEVEIVTLASILEREANDEISLKMVSGVLHNRLQSNMPLQVDAVFEYILGKGSEELTESDLRMESPYNTYTQTGFPPTPISNPGVLALSAALSPAIHDYFYYLTGDDGKFYYAETFEEHKQNKAQFLQ